jgi:splicing factor 3A subunit 3
VENLEKAYKNRPQFDADGQLLPLETDSMFTGEEAFGRFFDLVGLHEQYLNLPGIKGTRRLPYVQYLDSFDIFVLPQCPIKKHEKMTDVYFQYLGALVAYLEDFIKKVRPLENLDRLFASFDQEFDTTWADDKVVGWETSNGSTAGPQKPEGKDGFWCDYCEKEFGNLNVYQHHLTQKKHLRAVAQHKAGKADGNKSLSRIKEKAIAEREFRIKKLAAAMSTERSDTKVNVERRQGMTEHERQQENEALQAQGFMDANAARATAEESDSDDEERIHNPLGLPNGWDGKPIPYWLYKLHGLGVEFQCEICGNFTYMGRRAFEKHFTEARHDYGLKCLGIENTPLFREITGIEDALKLWDKIQKDKRKQRQLTENIVQMEDGEGNVMPEKVYNDLRKQGLL